MLCCAMGVAAVATGAIGWRRFRRHLGWRLNAQSAAQSTLAAVVVAMVTMTAAGVVVEHLGHHAAYAGDEQALLTDPLPLCRGGSSADRITANIEE